MTDFRPGNFRSPHADFRPDIFSSIRFSSCTFSFMRNFAWHFPTHFFIHVHAFFFFVRTDKGAATKFCLGGDGLMGTQTHLLPKFSFSSDFGHFIWEMLENVKKYTCEEKSCWNILISEGTSPLISRLRETRPPVPPFSAPMRTDDVSEQHPVHVDNSSAPCASRDC